ncbi:glycosyltransferase family 2 protein [Porticoccaceae bacterium]|nr:glycosyltransferase family 2 protein [Porticoccaceae bacterium]
MNADVTVIILTLNEELHIKRCIESLLLITQNIIIVDSLSTDATVEIAESLGIKIYQNPWPGNHARQFQWGLDNCLIETQWVMKMDADEYILPELAGEINSKLNSLDDNISGIFIKRQVYFMGRWIKHGGYYPVWLLRIWRYRDGKMEERWMDEHVKLSSGRTLRFDNDLVDDNRNDLTWWSNKHNHYATREAVDILNMLYGFKNYDGITPSFFGTQEQRKRKIKHLYVRLPLFLRPFIYFIWRYFVRAGFLDGKQGLIWHFLQGFWYRFLVDSKLHEIYSKAGKNKQNIKAVLKSDYGVCFESD